MTRIVIYIIWYLKSDNINNFL